MSARSVEKRATALKRLQAGRKRVLVAKWKWDHPQEITTLQRVSL